MAFHSAETGNIVTTQATRECRRTVDVHMHYITELYRDALASANMTSPDGINPLPPWDEEDFLQLTRKVNDAGQRLMGRYLLHAMSLFRIACWTSVPVSQAWNFQPDAGVLTLKHGRVLHEMWGSQCGSQIWAPSTAGL